MLHNQKNVEQFQIPKNWQYRGEGNCNLVLSLPDHKILRIRKTERPKTIISWILTWISDLLYWYFGNSYEEETRDLQFYLKIMRPLFGERYVSTAKQVLLSRRQIKSLEYHLNKLRPDFRKSKVLQYGRATLFDDFTYLPKEYTPFATEPDTFAIEIKPKSGWRPMGEKRSLSCLYCLNQFVKLEKKSIDSKSNYCPEDLFSGNPIKMIAAIKALILQPQNNLRIFKNGEIVYGNRTGEINGILTEIFKSQDSDQVLLKEFCDFISKCLRTNLMDCDKKESCEESFCKWNKIIQDSRKGFILPKGCVLEKILSVQMLDMEGTNYYSKMIKHKDFSNWSYVKKTLKQMEREPSFCIKCKIMMMSSERFNEEMLFVPYLIAAVANDCSLMITFKKICDTVNEAEYNNIVKTGFGNFVINIGVFDLYPKPMSTIKKHEKRNSTLIEMIGKVQPVLQLYHS